MTTFEQVLHHTLAIEAGYSNRLTDSGGETWRGISRRWHPKWEGWSLVDSYRSDPRFPECLWGDAKLAEMVEYFYFQKFWQPLRCEELPAPLRSLVFDTAVNTGEFAAVLLLQAALVYCGAELRIDGKIGSRTLAQASAPGIEPLEVARIWRLLQGGYYVGVCVLGNRVTGLANINGWVARARGALST